MGNIKKLSLNFFLTIFLMVVSYNNFVFSREINLKDFEIYLTYRSSSGKDHNLECCDFLNLDDLARVHHIKSDFSPDDIKKIA